MEYNDVTYNLPQYLIDKIEARAKERSELFRHEITPSSVARQWLEEGFDYSGTTYPEFFALKENCQKIAEQLDRIIPDNLPFKSKTILPLFVVIQESTMHCTKVKASIELTSDHYGETTNLAFEETMANLVKLKDGAGAESFWECIVDES